VLVIPDDVIGRTSVEYRKRGAMQGNLFDLIAEPTFCPSSPRAFKPFAQRLRHRFGFGFACQFCECGSKLFRLLISDVERHVITTCRQ
jgi:hypothetical protein